MTDIVSSFTCTSYELYPTVSAQEAYDKIVNGEFEYGGNGRLEIQVESCSLRYCLVLKDRILSIWMYD